MNDNKKIGDKRIRNDNFQQFEKCYTCKKGFWAKSRYELGNWERFCNSCQKKVDKKYQKKYAKEIKETLDFSTSVTFEIEKLACNIDDIIREKKRELLYKKLPMKLKWTEDEYNAIKLCMVRNGWFMPKGKSIKFMGISHSIVNNERE